MFGKKEKSQATELERIKRESQGDAVGKTKLIFVNKIVWLEENES